MKPCDDKIGIDNEQQVSLVYFQKKIPNSNCDTVCTHDFIDTITSVAGTCFTLNAITRADELIDASTSVKAY
ncbi:hypothetical protein RIR_jg11772.t1 [Rhizophagus irregularis DAOM 181602=DAOM 197198]|nr:hypothetical protein RIR_jg11772.t1 [Rhizophagus irregularis DAOM 181602=DAOM 197198]